MSPSPSPDMRVPLICNIFFLSIGWLTWLTWLGWRICLMHWSIHRFSLSYTRPTYALSIFSNQHCLTDREHVLHTPPRTNRIAQKYQNTKTAIILLLQQLQRHTACNRRKQGTKGTRVEAISIHSSCTVCTYCCSVFSTKLVFEFAPPKLKCYFMCLFFVCFCSVVSIQYHTIIVSYDSRHIFRQLWLLHRQKAKKWNKNFRTHH